MMNHYWTSLAAVAVLIGYLQANAVRPATGADRFQQQSQTAKAVDVVVPDQTLPALDVSSRIDPQNRIAVRRLDFNKDGRTVQLLDIKIDLQKLAPRVVDVFEGIHTTGYRSYTLNEVIRAIHPAVAVSGPAGQALSVPVALGLVVDNGRQASRVDRDSGFATGVLCISAARVPTIVHASDVRVASCFQAVQSGPIIVEPGGKVGIRPTELQLATMPHVIIGIEGTTGFHIFASTGAHLYDVAAVLARANISAALNLSSGLQNSAVVVSSGGPTFNYGNLNGAIPSALVFQSSK